jgi:hypothetical protein
VAKTKRFYETPQELTYCKHCNRPIDGCACLLIPDDQLPEPTMEENWYDSHPETEGA